MPERGTNTMAEGCQKILNEITKMKVMPDADMNFLAQLEGGVISYLKAPTPDMTDQMGNPSSGAQGLDGAMQQVMGGSPGMPNPDELRRTLGQ